ncbi:MAG: hypothetical protein NTY70_09870 [Burkholderiales bacterium]|nr:hypothetical protein [Burkholderiales bacterium]
MPVIVNGYELNDAEMEQELPDHQDGQDASLAIPTYGCCLCFAP